jgi:hypothetical protein
MPDAADQDGPQMYAHLRGLALGQTAAELGLEPADSERTAYGAVMDWSSDDWTATLAAFRTGDVSLYLSNGGGVIGGRDHAEVREAGFACAQSHLAAMRRTTEFPRPAPANCRFFVLTNRGVFMADDTEQALASGASPLADLGSAGQKALFLLRSTDQPDP